MKEYKVFDFIYCSGCVMRNGEIIGETSAHLWDAVEDFRDRIKEIEKRYNRFKPKDINRFAAGVCFWGLVGLPEMNKNADGFLESDDILRKILKEK